MNSSPKPGATIISGEVSAGAERLPMLDDHTALVIAFFTYRRAKADAAKSQKAGENDWMKP
jgi:hypothetical protein